MQSWLEYWNTDTPIYVSERHKLLHYAGIAKDIARLIPSRGAHVLDYACGDALAAERVAAQCASLTLCEAAPAILARLKARFSDAANIRVIDSTALASSPDAHFDMAVVSSLLQYLKPAELLALLDVLHAKLKSDGVLIIADVVPPDVNAVTDALALLRFAAQGGFLIRAVFGLARTFFSSYRKLRGELGLATHTEAALAAILQAKGFEAKRQTTNIGHNPARMTFVARKAG